MSPCGNKVPVEDKTEQKLFFLHSLLSVWWHQVLILHSQTFHSLLWQKHIRHRLQWSIADPGTVFGLSGVCISHEDVSSPLTFSSSVVNVVNKVLQSIKRLEADVICGPYGWATVPRLRWSSDSKDKWVWPPLWHYLCWDAPVDGRPNRDNVQHRWQMCVWTHTRVTTLPEYLTGPKVSFETSSPPLLNY